MEILKIFVLTPFIPFFFLASAQTRDINCVEKTEWILNKIRGAQEAKDVHGQGVRETGEALQLLENINDMCESALWYVAASRGLASRLNRKNTVKSGTEILQTSRDALEAGLRKYPDDADLLAEVAHLSFHSPLKSPPLPFNACETVLKINLKSDAVNYVCGLEKFLKKEYSEAVKLFSKIDILSTYTDAALLMAQSLIAAGKKTEAKKILKKFLKSKIINNKLGLTTRDIEDIRKKAKEILQQIKLK